MAEKYELMSHTSAHISATDNVFIGWSVGGGGSGGGDGAGKTGSLRPDDALTRCAHSYVGVGRYVVVLCWRWSENWAVGV